MSKYETLERMIASVFPGARNKYIWDMETTTNWEHGPSAHVNGTKIVRSGIIELPDQNVRLDSKWCSADDDTRAAFVGHNVSFDALHAIKAQQQAPLLETSTSTWMLKNLALGDVVLWDTQDIEYILSGHSHKFASLDELAEGYGVTKKMDTLKNYFEKKINTDAIPSDELEKYLSQDIVTTAMVADAQARMIEAGGASKQQIELACMRRAVTTIMMHNGMPFDVDSALKYKAELEEEIIAIEEKWKHILKPWGTSSEQADQLQAFAHEALTSPKKLDVLFFGGNIKVTKVVEVGFYKNGKPKTKKEAVLEHRTGLFSGVPIDLCGTDEHALSAVREHVLKEWPTSTLYELIDLVLKYRELAKLYSTYITPLIGMAMVSKDGRIHPSLNTTATATGRLSSSKPNAQNMPTHSPVKSLFRQDDWTCIEGDYKQLEMIGLAIKTGDKQLLTDLDDGVDIHYEVGRDVFGWTDPTQMTKETRRIVKSVDFGLVYGGKAKTLSEQSGAPIHVVQQVIDSFFKRYPQVAEYHKRMEQISKDQDIGVVVGTHDDGTPQRRLDVYCAITSRKYSLFTYPPMVASKNKYYKPKATFSPTELKNYFVQGFATADFVPFACAMLARSMAAAGWMDLEKDGQPKAKLCNTVHDSIVVWVKDEYALEFATFMKAAMESAWPLMFKYFGADDSKRMDTQVVAEISVGPSWGETKEIKFDE